MKQIYLAGAMEVYGKESKEVSDWRNIATNILCDFGDYKIISPPDYYEYGNNYQKTDLEVFRFDLHKVKTSDVILVNLKDIRKSIGTSDEIMYAYMHDIPVVGFLETPYELNEEEIIKEIHSWKYIQINRVETGDNALYNAICYLTEYYMD